MKKLLCCMMAAIVFLLSPLSAFASTTESAIIFASVDDYSLSPASIPTNFNIALYGLSRNNDTNLSNITDPIYLVDGSSDYQAVDLGLSGNSGEKSVGFSLAFHPNIDGGFYSQHYINLSALDFRLVSSEFLPNTSSNKLFSLSPYAVPRYAYAVYTGEFEYQIYDGSAGYERWIYDNSFTLRKPVQVNIDSFGQMYGATDSVAGLNYTISTPAISSSDLLDVTAYKNLIANSIEFEKNTVGDVDLVTIEDFPTENIRINNDYITVYVLYDINDINFVPYAFWMGDYTVDKSLDGYTYSLIHAPSLYSNNLTSVNVNADDYLKDTNSGLHFIANGFSQLSRSFVSNISNVVTNATDNANRIIQNTTQKVDEVKQGVTEVKDSVIETKNSILDLPNKIKDMLLGLIVPSSETMSNKFSEFSNLLEEKLGIIYQVPMMLFDFFDTIVNAATTPQTTLTLPAFQLPWIDGSTLTVWQPMEYKIIPDGMQVLSDLIKTITSMTVVVLTFNSVKRAYERFLRS